MEVTRKPLYFLPWLFILISEPSTVLQFIILTTNRNRSLDLYLASDHWITLCRYLYCLEKKFELLFKAILNF